MSNYPQRPFSQPPAPPFLGPPVGGAYNAYAHARPQRPPSSNTTLWIVLGVFGSLFCVMIVALGIVGVIVGDKSGSGSSAAKVEAKAPPDSGWPMEFYANGVKARSFSEHKPDGSAEVIGVSVHAPKPFLELGASSFSFEVCRLVDGERSNWHCDLQNLFVDPAKKSQKDGVRSYTIKEGPGIYQARLVEYGTFGADDKIYSSATFVVH